MDNLDSSQTAFAFGRLLIIGILALLASIATAGTAARYRVHVNYIQSSFTGSMYQPNVLVNSLWWNRTLQYQQGYSADVSSTIQNLTYTVTITVHNLLANKDTYAIVRNNSTGNLATNKHVKTVASGIVDLADVYP